MLGMVDRFQSYVVASSLIWWWSKIQWMRRTRIGFTRQIILHVWRNRAIPCLRVVVKRLQVNIIFIVLFMDSLWIVHQLHIVNTHHLLANWRVHLLIVTGSRKVFSSALRNDLLVVFWVRQAVYWATSSDIFGPYLYAVSIGRIPQIIVANVVSLRKSIFHPGLITISIVFVGALVSWMVVEAGVLARVCSLEGTLIGLLNAILAFPLASLTISEITLLSKLGFIIEIFLYRKSSLIFRLFNSAFGVNGREV